MYLTLLSEKVSKTTSLKFIAQLNKLFRPIYAHYYSKKDKNEENDKINTFILPLV